MCEVTQLPPDIFPNKLGGCLVKRASGCEVEEAWMSCTAGDC